MSAEILNVYEDCPEHYDLIYQRFLKSVPFFRQLVSIYTPPGGRVLDLAAGTGEVTIPLAREGFEVTGLDMSSGMLRELKRKAEDLRIQTILADMANLRGVGQFDTICIRQGINYIQGVPSLRSFCQEVFDHLKSPGYFIFNAPNFDPKSVSYPVVWSENQIYKWHGLVVEQNTLEGRELSHLQHSLVWHESSNTEVKHLVDQNHFYMYTPNEFKDCLLSANFNEISFQAPKTKALYGVARKGEPYE